MKHEVKDDRLQYVQFVANNLCGDLKKVMSPGESIMVGMYLVIHAIMNSDKEKPIAQYEHTVKTFRQILLTIVKQIKNQSGSTTDNAPAASAARK